MSKYQTEQRKLIVSVFEENRHKTFSAKDVYKLLENSNISISAIYRNLSQMEEEGRICKISEKNRTEIVYQYVCPQECEGIIHLKCYDCENTFHLNKHVSRMILDMAKDDFSFSINVNGAFLYGKCEKCSQI